MTRAQAVEAWMNVGRALAASGDKADRELARSIAMFVQKMPLTARATEQSRASGLTSVLKPIDFDPPR